MVGKREGIATDSYASRLYTWTVTLHWLLLIHLCEASHQVAAEIQDELPMMPLEKVSRCWKKVAPHQATAMASTGLSKEASFETKLGFLIRKDNIPSDGKSFIYGSWSTSWSLVGCQNFGIEEPCRIVKRAH